jgi:cation-transporting ATPase 13A1
MIKRFLAVVPEDYDESYLAYSRRGARVLALATKVLPPQLSVEQLRKMDREQVEDGLTFCGFSVFECPVKAESKETVLALKESAHNVVMITGDNTLTACYGAKQLGIVERKLLCPRTEQGEQGEEETISWVVDGGDADPQTDIAIPSWGKELTAQQEEYFDFCVDGRHTEAFFSLPPPVIRQLLDCTKVYARVSPDDKETILALMKKHGHTTLMCGDGTNDVGALKQAHIGIALLNAEWKAPVVPTMQQIMQKQKQMMQQRQQQRVSPADLRKEMMKQFAEQDNPAVKLGDASIASPFTCRSISVKPILHILRQGRCTLVTTLQMYKILATNCLINAYSMSVLYVAGIKMGDSQAMVVGFLTAFCFLFISRSKPLDKLSKKRPIANLFHPYMFLSVVLQFVVHLVCLFAAFNLAKAVPGSYLTPPDYIEEESEAVTETAAQVVENATQALNATAAAAFNGTLPGDNNFSYLDAEFSPNLVNSVVYLITCCQLISTFTVNYRGHPFMQSMRENKGLSVCLALLTGITFMFVLELSPDLNKSFKITPMPSDSFKFTIAAIMLLDIVVTVVFEKILQAVFRLIVPKDTTV